jgi:hypothetical protein
MPIDLKFHTTADEIAFLDSIGTHKYRAPKTENLTRCWAIADAVREGIPQRVCAKRWNLGYARIHQIVIWAERSLRPADLLRRYIEAAENKVNWGGVDKREVVAYAKKLLKSCEQSNGQKADKKENIHG